jgi:acyl-CoA thioesterase FadM
MDWLSEALTLALAGTNAAPNTSAITPRYYHIQYIHPARPGDRMVISTRLDRTGSRRLTAVQAIRDDATGQIAVECSSAHLLLRPQ